jgi:hypothetical protein
VEVPVLGQEVAAAFLLARTGSADKTAAEELAAELGGLPLALEQASAYIEATGRSVAGYLAMFRRRRVELLGRGEIAGSDKQVATAWALAFDRLQRTAPEAIGLLRLLSCFAPERIPLDVLLQSRRAMPSGPDAERLLLSWLEDPLAADSAVAALRRYSLVSLSDGRLLSVHRLVQAVTLAQLPADEVKIWQRAARSLIDVALPADIVLPGAWPICAASSYAGHTQSAG